MVIKMRISIIYDSKYGNTRSLSDFLEKNLKNSENEVRTFQSRKSNLSELKKFQPEIILFGGPTHFGKPTNTLIKFIKSLGKSSENFSIKKAAVYNCYYGDMVGEMIKDQILLSLPQTVVFKEYLAQPFFR